MSKDIFELQREFMRACEQIVSDKPGLNTESTLWRTLIQEESRELLNAFAAFHAAPTANALAAVAKEAADLIYVVAGLCNNLGIDGAAVYRAVHASNMTKVDPTTGSVMKREDGKILKPVGYKAPDVLSIITGGKYHDETDRA